jgi:hypothetical protein
MQTPPAMRPSIGSFAFAAVLLTSGCALDADPTLEYGSTSQADTVAVDTTELVGLYVDGFIGMNDTTHLVRFDVLSTSEVQLVLRGKAHTATLDEAGAFRFQIHATYAIGGRLLAGKRVEFDNPIFHTTTIAYLRPVDVAPLTDEQVALGVALDSRIGQVARFGELELRVLPGFALSVKRSDWTGRTKIDAVGAVRLDGTFYARDEGNGNRVSGRILTDGAVQLTSVPEPWPSAPFEGELVPAAAPGPLAIRMWASANAWLKNANYPTNWARLTITSATTVLLDDWFGKVPLTVDAHGFILGQAKNRTEIQGLVTRDGRVLISGHSFTLRNDRPGAFTVLWDEENLRCGSSTGGGWCELVPGSANQAANRAALKWFRDHGLGGALWAGLVPSSVGDLRPEDYSALVRAMTDLARLVVTPEQQPIKDQALVDFAQYNTLRTQLADGKMTSEALSFLEDNVYYYVRPLPVAEHDTAARAALATFLEEHVGVSKGATNGSSTVARATVVAPDRIEIRLLDSGAPTMFEAPIAPDGAFGYRHVTGWKTTGHVTPHGKVVLKHRFEDIGPMEWTVDLLKI